MSPLPRHYSYHDTSPWSAGRDDAARPKKLVDRIPDRRQPGPAVRDPVSRLVERRRPDRLLGRDRGAYVLVDDVPGEGWATLDPIRGELQMFAALMLASHGVSFVTNFIGKKEYRLLKKDPEQLMVAPYRRVFVMMTSVVVGAILVFVTGAPSTPTSIFIVLKIVADVIAHLNQHDMIRKGGDMIQGGEMSPMAGEA